MLTRFEKILGVPGWRTLDKAERNKRDVCFHPQRLCQTNPKNRLLNHEFLPANLQQKRAADQATKGGTRKGEHGRRGKGVRIRNKRMIPQRIERKRSFTYQSLYSLTWWSWNVLPLAGCSAPPLMSKCWIPRDHRRHSRFRVAYKASRLPFRQKETTDYGKSICVFEPER